MSEPLQRHLAHWLNVFGAVLIVVGTIGVAASLVRSSRSPSPPLASSAGGVQHSSIAHTSTMYSVVSDAGGLHAVMRLTPGPTSEPYFLGELVVADLSLTNSSRTTYTLASSGCGGALYVRISGGTGPHFSLPTTQQFISCPLLGTTLKPGQVLTSHQLLALPSSAEVTVQLGADFLQSHTGPDGEQDIGPAGHSPLDGHWPSVTLSVAPSAPLDRRITLQQTGTTVQVHAPLSARSSLYYRYTLDCSDPINDPQAGTAVDTVTGWQYLARTALHEPTCGGGDDPHVRWSTVHWSYAVAAPGFAIAAGEQG